jgi:DNA-binding MarR family transcriptional regulator
MKKYIFYVVAVALAMATGCKEVENIPILERKFGRSIISRGDNIPDFDIRKDSANFLLIYLHENKSLSEFKEDTKLDDETVNKTIALLKSKDWLTEKDGKLKPSVFVVTAKDGEKLYRYAQKISKQIADEIEKELQNVKAEFAKTDMAKNQSFEHWSFLILSNVLLDNWQIFEMEKNFFKRPDGKEYNRPLRHGKYYYASIQENAEKDREPFGIYGNAIMSFSPDKMIAVYGNNRYSSDYYRKLQSSDNHISNDDDGVLIKMAQDFLPKLLNILEKNREYIEKVYRETGYSQKISFEEFFLWWYHYIYTQATNDMNDRGILIIPSNGNFDYERS